MKKFKGKSFYIFLLIIFTVYTIMDISGFTLSKENAVQEVPVTENKETDSRPQEEKDSFDDLIQILPLLWFLLAVTVILLIFLLVIRKAAPQFPDMLDEFLQIFTDKKDTLKED